MPCIFCQITTNQKPAYVIAKNSRALAFLDLNPVSNGHCLVIPKQHSDDFTNTPVADLTDVMILAQQVSKQLLASLLKPHGFNFISNQTYLAGQRVFHFHVHIIPKYNAQEGIFFQPKLGILKPLQEVYDLIHSCQK